MQNTVRPNSESRKWGARYLPSIFRDNTLLTCRGKVYFNVNRLSASCIYCNDVIMSAMASQIISLTIVYSGVYSGADHRKHQSSASLAFVRGIHRWPVNSPHIGSVMRKCFHLMTSLWDSTTSKGISQKCDNWFLYELIQFNSSVWHTISKNTYQYIHRNVVKRFTQIARFIAPAWGASGADRTQVGPMLAPWTLLSGLKPRTRIHCATMVFSQNHSWFFNIRL